MHDAPSTSTSTGTTRLRHNTVLRRLVLIVRNPLCLRGHLTLVLREIALYAIEVLGSFVHELGRLVAVLERVQHGAHLRLAADVRARARLAVMRQPAQIAVFDVGELERAVSDAVRGRACQAGLGHGGRVGFCGVGGVQREFLGVVRPHYV